MQFTSSRQSDSTLLIPLFMERVPCGFPSPAQDYVEDSLDLNKLVVKHPGATYFVRVSGDSMTEAGISHGDLLVVDRSLTAVHGDIIIAAVGGEFTVKELQTYPRLQLMPRNANYAPVVFGAEDELEILALSRLP
jgi:DNA polymerase V